MDDTGFLIIVTLKLNIVTLNNTLLGKAFKNSYGFTLFLEEGGAIKGVPNIGGMGGTIPP